MVILTPTPSCPVVLFTTLPAIVVMLLPPRFPNALMFTVAALRVTPLDRITSPPFWLLTTARPAVVAPLARNSAALRSTVTVPPGPPPGPPRLLPLLMFSPPVVPRVVSVAPGATTIAPLLVAAALLSVRPPLATLSVPLFAIVKGMLMVAVPELTDRINVPLTVIVPNGGALPL